MKNIFFLLVCFILSHSLSAQEEINPQIDKKIDQEVGRAYLQRSDREKTAAWVLFGSGMLISIAGFLVRARMPAKRRNIAFSFCLGTGLSLGSVLLFISGIHNRQKAGELMQSEPPKPSLVQIAK